MSYNIIFFGTSELAIPSLKSLMDDPRFKILGIVTQPDRPTGRHAELTASPVKQFVTDSSVGMTIKQPEKLKDEAFVSWIKDVGPTCDAFVIISYGKILPQWLLELPRRGTVNVHPSLLPRWRGPSPIQAAIAAGDPVTGVTIMLIDAEMDHGPILAQAEEVMHPEDTGDFMHDRLAELGAQMLPDILSGHIAGNIRPKEQDHDLTTFCKILTREDGKLDLTKSSKELERLVRAYHPWPGTWIDLNGKRLKILASRVGPTDTSHPSDERFILDHRPYIACGQGTTLELVEVQPEGKKHMTGQAFIAGYLDSFMARG